MSNNLLSLGGWYFLPQLVTGWVQSAYYAIWIRAGDPKPQPGSRLHQRDRKRIHILVILAYLLYTIYEADHQLLTAGDFYRDLGVTHSIDDRGLQSRFRRLTITHHPDKVTDAALRPRAEAVYVHLKLCRDTLVDPARRFAYDRFGPDSLGWRSRTTIADFAKAGVQNAVVYYAATGGVMVVLGMIGYLQQASLWRYTALASLFLLELSLSTRPDSPPWLSSLLNPFLQTFTSHSPYLPFQFLSLARKLVLTFFIALSQIGPLISTKSAGQGEGGGVQGAQVDRMAGVVGHAEVEVGRLLGLEVAPFATDVVGGQAGQGEGVQGGVDAVGMAELKTRMRRWLVDNTVRSNAEVRSAIGRVIERRRAGVPAGAAGAR